ncbi:argininosuccinate synthase [Dethiosulfovibrio acidaminovorans]|uniref:Argininosuccinate synthase n=2 Tax=Dethiosulfovibrio TaxID=47054 RepID=A0ABS9ERT2_9BACT|nr:argininosuccinate synthase [Dethiosulfovibrio russensis]MCF4142862.1 argininosuccinate synthase [Dethiosulfovibrio marinus]MCF4144809.1 argininosuccinate synthase [Dethiosulfovibrio acidaminovorans]
MEKKGKVVLAYSGGLDTSVAVCWLMERGYDVVTLTADVGQSVNLEEKKAKALKTGAVAAYVMDLKKQFVQEFVWPSLKANGMYQGTYPLSSALSRPLISQQLAWVAKNEGAVAVAHGCTGKGQDQVRFEVAIGALNPELEVIAPVRDWHFSREAEIEYAKEHGIEVGASVQSPYSIDENLWGRAIECGALEDPWNECPEDAFQISVAQEVAPDKPQNVEITFEKGVPVALDGVPMDGVSLILKLREIAGAHGVGRIDMLEDRLVGFKSREVYECPAAITLIAAHRALETMTLSKEVLAEKKRLEASFAELAYTGYWFSPLKEAIDAFVDKTQENVNGTVRVKLFKGMATVTGLKSLSSVYSHDLATYSEEDSFDHSAAVGFIKVWGLPLKTWKQAHKQDPEKNESISVSC